VRLTARAPESWTGRCDVMSGAEDTVPVCTRVRVKSNGGVGGSPAIFATFCLVRLCAREDIGDRLIN